MFTWFKQDITIPYPKIRGELKNIHYPCAVEQKVDGELDFVVFENNSVEMVNKYDLHRKDFSALKELQTLNLKDHIIIGELYFGKNLYDFLRNKKSNELKFAVFDFFKFERQGDFYRPVKNLDYNLRRHLLEFLFLGQDFKYISLIESRIAHNESELLKIRDEFIAQGFEGAVAKNLNSFLTSGETKDWVKLKKIKSADLVVLGYSRKREHLSLYLGYKENGTFKGLCNCSVASWNEQRILKALLQNLVLPEERQVSKENILIEPKLVVEVSYQELIETNGRISLRHPVYIRLTEKTKDEVSLC